MLRFYLENIPLDNRFLVSILISWLTRISPWLNLNLIIRREFKVPIKISPTNILNCDNNCSRLDVFLARKVAEIPIITLKPLLQSLYFDEIQSFDIQKEFLIVIQIFQKFRVDFVNGEILPECRYRNRIISYVNDFQKWVGALSKDRELTLLRLNFQLVCIIFNQVFLLCNYL